jgi:hypothetical protein
MSRYAPDQRIDEETRTALPPVIAAIMRVVRDDEDVMHEATGVTYDSLRAYATGHKFPTAERLKDLLAWLDKVGIEIDLPTRHITIDLKKYAKKISEARRSR